MKESDLFLPIKEYFEAQGWSGDGEVAGIDLFLEKDGFTAAVELKKTLDFRAVQQAALDQKVCDFAYIGIFRPGDLYSGSARDKLYLLRRLGIGLICVSPRSGRVEQVCEPVVSELPAIKSRSKDKAEAVMNELKGRKLKSNTGGVKGTRLLTAYREESLAVLKGLMSLGGEASSRSIREVTADPKATSILYDNYYGWFERVSRGVYRISGCGHEAAEEYSDIIDKI